MARTPMVTRTIKSTQVKLLVLNVTSKQVEELELSLPRTYESEEKILKYIADSKLTPENIKPVTVIKTEVKENLYGIEEVDFIKLATIITKQPLEETK